MSFLSRIGNAFGSSRLDRELAEELQFHIDARIEELVRAGVPLREAERQARRRFGNAPALRERSRDAKLVPWLESLVKDARFGARMLAKNRAATAAAIVSLSLALGSSIAAFELIDALILRPLPVYQPKRLVYFTYNPDGQREREIWNYPFYQQLREAVGARAELFTASGQNEWDVAMDGNAIGDARVQWVSGNMFSVLGLVPATGRLIEPADDRAPGASPVAVISYRYWMRRFGGNPTAIGRWLTTAEKRFQIVGVAPRSFSGLEPGIETDIWVPNMMWDQRAFTDWGWGWFRTLGRLAPGVTPAQLQEPARAAYANFRRAHVHEMYRPDAPRDAMERYLKTPLNVRPAANGPSEMRQSFTRPLLILAIVAGLVLLIACSNLANLFTARALAREREMAMRISIGAGRARLLQQVLMEGALLAGASCALGLAFARAAAPLIVGMLSTSDRPAFLDLRGDWRILAFTAGMGFATVLLFALVPALRASRVAPNEALKSGGGKTSGRIGALRPMVAAQVAFSFAVLFIGGLLLATFQKLTSVDLGFTKSGVTLFHLRAKEFSFNSPFVRTDSIGAVRAGLEWLDRVRTVPGVRSASLSEWALLSGSGWDQPVRVPGRPIEVVTAYHLPVSAGFFQTMGIRMLAGRDFDARDWQAGAAAVVVNESFARHYFPGEDPLGKRYFRPHGSQDIPQEIVGLVRDAHYDRIREPAPATVYVPLRGLDHDTLEVRTAVDPALQLEALRRAIDGLSPGIRVTDATLQTTLVDNALVQQRLVAILAGFFVLVAMVLAAVGLYGVLSYAVVRRTREIGIRVALGARRAAVVRLVISEIALVTGLGLACGAGGGLLLARYVEKLLYEVKPSDLASIAAPLASLLLAAALAAVAPAVRAARVDPTVALRYE